MVLKNLQLTNFRQYQQLSLSFRDGVTGIVGRNGSGKSTILEAILWCLFGNRGARTVKDTIKRQTATGSEVCRVVLEFELGGKLYKLSRSLVGKNNRSEANLIRQGELDTVTTREVDSYIVRLIGMNLKGFLSSFFARQKELNALTDARPGDRKDHLARMLGVGRLDESIEYLKEDIKLTRLKIETMSRQLIDPDEVTSEVFENKSRLTRAERLATQLGNDLQALDNEIRKSESVVNNLKIAEKEHFTLEKQQEALTIKNGAARKEIDKTGAELADLDLIEEKTELLKDSFSDLEKLRESLSEFKKVEILENEKSRQEQELADIAKQNIEATKQWQEITGQIEKSEEGLKRKNDVLRQLEEDEENRDKLIGEYNDLSTSLKMLKGEIRKIDDQKNKINQLGPNSVCGFCLRPFGEEFPQIEKHFEQELLSLNHKVDPLDLRLNEIEKNGKMARKRIVESRQKIDEFNRIERTLASGRASFSGLMKRIDEAENRRNKIIGRLKEIGDIKPDPKQVSGIETQIDRKQKDKDEFIKLSERLSRRDGLKAGLNEARSTAEETDRELLEIAEKEKELGFDSGSFQKAQTDLDDNRVKMNDVRLDLKESEGTINLLKSNLKSLADKLDNYNKIKVEIEQLRESLTYYEKLSILFGEFRVYLIGRIRPILSKTTSRLFYEMSAGRYQEVELDEDYNLCMFDRGQSFPVSRFSGGEIDLVNLCFRLAISLEMARTAGLSQGFIILDEIFGSQDSERQRMIIEGLARLKNHFRQIIIITHIEEVKDMAENIISVYIDESGLSQVQTREAG